MNLISLKDVISIKIKARHDSYTDQWNRIFMCKILLITSIIIGIDYFNDEISCIVPTNAEIDSNFVKSACWISGFYIYPELRGRWKHAGYHGIPKDLSLDGLDREDNELCSVISKYGEPDVNCEPLKKEFYLQYQWYPFFVATLGLLYYLPYILFRIANTDIISLNRTLDSDLFDANSIIRNYFNYNLNPIAEMRFRVVLTDIVKFLYIAVNVFSLYTLNTSLNGKFLPYGINWVNWSKRNITVENHIELRRTLKPGNELLPPMGICEVHESSRDVRNTLLNRHKFICEISQNILYQYCFLLIWFLLVFSLVISILGFIYEIYCHCAMLWWLIWRPNDTTTVYRSITVRECQYLKIIRSKNAGKYGEIVHRLKKDRIENNMPLNWDGNESN